MAELRHTLHCSNNSRTHSNKRHFHIQGAESQPPSAWQFLEAFRTIQETFYWTERTKHAANLRHLRHMDWNWKIVRCANCLLFYRKRKCPETNITQQETITNLDFRLQCLRISRHFQKPTATVTELRHKSYSVIYDAYLSLSADQ